MKSLLRFKIMRHTIELCAGKHCNCRVRDDGRESEGYELLAGCLTSGLLQ